MKENDVEKHKVRCDDCGAIFTELEHAMEAHGGWEKFLGEYKERIVKEIDKKIERGEKKEGAGT